MQYQPCVVDGVCQLWENNKACPSDCPASTTTTLIDAVGGQGCGNGVCDAGETVSTCPFDCKSTGTTLQTTTTTAPAGTGLLSGAFSALQRFNVFTLAILLSIIAAILAVIRFKVLKEPN